MTSIIGYAELLLQEPGLGAEEIRFTQSMLRQSHKLADHVEKLLRFIDLEGLETRELPAQPFDIEDVISGTIDKLGPWLKTYGASAAIKGVAPEVAFGSPGLIRGVVQNLVENAVKYNPKNVKKVTIRTESKDGEIETFVRDNGDGISQEDQEKILRGFYQSEIFFTGPVEGLGLGLAFVKRVVQYHGGQVSLKSELGEGTIISFTLPRKRK